MKLIIICTICCITTPAWSIFGISGFKKEINHINTDLSAVKQQSDTLNNELTGVKMRIKKLEVNLNAQADITAGINKSIKAGRDVTTTQTNDTSLMKNIINGLVGLCGTLIVGLVWCLKALIKRSKEKMFYKEQTLIHAKDEEERIKLRRLHDSYVKGRKE